MVDAMAPLELLGSADQDGRPSTEPRVVLAPATAMSAWEGRALTGAGAPHGRWSPPATLRCWTTRTLLNKGVSRRPWVLRMKLLSHAGTSA